MTALRERGRAGRNLRCRAAAALLVAAIIAIPAAAVAAEPVVVVLDQATMMKFPERVATIVIGNPLIADVSMQAGGVAVVTGKGHGVTNVVALDRSGAVLMERLIQVRGPHDNVVVMYRGIERETYNCTPTCARRVALGDSNAFFTQNLTQTSTLNTQAVGSSQAASR